MITKEEVIILIDDVKKAYQTMVSVNKVVRTCNVSANEGPTWHMFNKEDFDHVVNLFEVNVASKKLVTNYIKHTCFVRGVEIFCLTPIPEEEEVLINGSEL